MRPNVKTATSQPKSFADLLKLPPVDIHKSSIPDPIIRGEDTVIRIDDVLYTESLKSFENALIGRFILSKGTQPTVLMRFAANCKTTTRCPNLKSLPLDVASIVYFFLLELESVIR